MVIRTVTAEYSTLGENIIVCRLFENALVDTTEIKENYEATMKCADGKPYVALVDARCHVTVTREARELAIQPEFSNLQIAQAIVTHSLANRIVANFIIKFHKRMVPTKLFPDTKVALEWLKEKLAERGLGQGKDPRSGVNLNTEL
jgi:hypothetical protein